MKILYLTHHWGGNSHHSKYSGYQQLVFTAQKNHDCTVITWGNENKEKEEGNIKVYYIKPVIKKDYFFAKRLAISRFAKKIEKEYDIVHALYSDCAYFQKHKKLISTIHISPFIDYKTSFLEHVFLLLKYFIIEKKVIKNSKHLVLMSKNLIDDIKCDNKKCIFIPHGINTYYWDPEKLTKKTNQNNYVLSVGNNGIDKEVLNKVIINNPEIPFITVGLKKFNYTYNNLTKLSGISDEELKDLYNNCILFIRPMGFATANNSVLEALSMNKPVLLSTPNGTYDYFEDNLEYLRVVKSHQFCDHFNCFYKHAIDYNNDNSIRSYAINNFSWESIFERIYKLYE